MAYNQRLRACISKGGWLVHCDEHGAGCGPKQGQNWPAGVQAQGRTFACLRLDTWELVSLASAQLFRTLFWSLLGLERALTALQTGSQFLSPLALLFCLCGLQTPQSRFYKVLACAKAALAPLSPPDRPARGRLRANLFRLFESPYPASGCV